jgi:ATP-dependent protease Clp ATPase subunit
VEASLAAGIPIDTTNVLFICDVAILGPEEIVAGQTSMWATKNPEDDLGGNGSPFS